MEKSAYTLLREVHAFFSRYPEWLPETASRIGLFLNDEKNGIKSLIDIETFKNHYEINSAEIQALHHYIHSHNIHQDSNTILTLLLSNRGVHVNDEMIKQEFTVIMWLGSNVGSFFMDSLIDKIKNNQA